MEFGNWDEKIHEEKDQRIRYSRALSSDRKFLSIDKERKTGEFVGSEGELYYVTLNDCSCQDFKKRGKPCKHIYQLALELGYKKEENSESPKDITAKLKNWLRTPADKIGFAIMLFGVISVIMTQSAGNGTTFGQSLLVGCVFVVIGLLVRKFGNKKAPVPNSTDAEAPEDPLGSVYVYSGSKVYHTNRYCSESYENVPLVLSAEEAEDKGYRKCKKCEKIDQAPTDY